MRQVLETTGPVLVTSNKRDIVDATRGPRAEHGAVWVNGLQQLAGEPPSWWWNPLRRARASPMRSRSTQTG
jgi:hypothetical protein